MIYLDNSATTAALPEVVAKMQETLMDTFGNPSSMHHMGVIGENHLKTARADIAATLKCKDKEILFTSGGTESNNLAILGATAAKKRRGMHVITTSIEHASVYETMKHLEAEGYEVTFLPVNKEGVIDLEVLEKSVRPDTVLVSLMAVNNEIGTIEPIEEAAKIIKRVNPDTLIHVDAIQAYGKIPMIPKKLGIHLMSVSGHKIHGPKGSGFLYIADGVRVLPIIYGGGQEQGLRSGTENVPAIAGLGVASKIAISQLEENSGRMRQLRERFIDGVTAIDGVTINGPADSTKAAPHIISVSVRGVRSEVMLHSLEDYEVYVSAGSACSSNKPAISRTLKNIGLDKLLLDSTIRISLSKYTTEAEIDEAIRAFSEIVPKLQKYMRK